jgi:hypothetical protein
MFACPTGNIATILPEAGEDYVIIDGLLFIVYKARN